MIKAEIICDSISDVNGDRLTTFILTFPRFLLAEFNTHREFSRNSASSRAIKFSKMFEMVWENPFIPMKWMKDHTGMQGKNYFEGTKVFILRNFWLFARSFAMMFAWILSKFGLTKQICNRLLEPFMYHKVLVTSTEWENFFALRAHDAAEIHFQELAFKMLEAYNNSFPKHLQSNEWHIPFGDKLDEERLKSFFEWSTITKDDMNLLKLKISIARCARISYNNFEGKDDYESDLKLHDRLSSSGHWSPFEHCAKVMSKDEYETNIRKNDNGIEGGWCGNFKGFKQYRKMFKNERQNDERIIKDKIILE